MRHKLNARDKLNRYEPQISIMLRRSDDIETWPKVIDACGVLPKATQVDNKTRAATVVRGQTVSWSAD